MDYASWKEVPKELKGRIKFVGSARGASDRSNTRFWCEEWSVCDGVLTIRGVLMDTSDMAYGVSLQPRISYVDECHLGGSFAWTLRPIPLEEK